MQHRLCGRLRWLVTRNHQSADFAGPERRQFDGDQRTTAAADQIHFAQPELIDQVRDRGGEVCNRHAGSRRVRCAAARQIRRIDRTISSEHCRTGLEIGAGAALGMQEQERSALVEAAARRECRGQVQLAVAAIHIHAS